ncbi:multi- copper enzyme maturation ABC-type transport system permease component-like protein [Alicyclobacillus hesperidum URH17-3-68]|uniref:hypothetical protein n=1 Tax=Alicyclobacillus hesperidum TaxID=89784 RepID=UPI000281C2EC|nr:hypothetical protein [Alicyclobacillus hesperidum]EJY54982.1 multi- copper enzyme maturation ABC-type transport system permease component-like protein [Alicyclobacillus hesperidum URH17-3-68]
MNIEERTRQRFQFLKTVYELTDGDPHSYVDMWEIGRNQGLNPSDTQNIVTWLSNEGLLGDGFIGGGISISHKGVQEIETALSHPKQRTRYFPPVLNIVNIGNMTNSQLQQGTTASTQTLTQSPVSMDSIRNELEKLKSAIANLHLDDETSAEVEAQIQTVEAQLKSKRPIHIVIEESIKSLRNLLEGTTASLIASGILSMITQHPH